MAQPKDRCLFRQAALAGLALTLGTLAPYCPCAAQMQWREYPSYERGWSSSAELPTDYLEPGEFVVGRLMFPQARRGWALGTGGGDWRRGGTAWAVDYPRGDRRFA
jgi:hypothetical protein